MNYIITSKPGMTPFHETDNLDEAVEVSEQAKQSGLNGKILAYAPMPNDNWYTIDEFNDQHRAWQTAPLSRFYLIDDGSSFRWIPEGL